MTLTLYSAIICPYAHRARIALKEVGVEHEIVEIDLSNKPEWYTATINPYGKVPALRLSTGQIIIESLIIVDYLLEEYDANKSLIPSSAARRAEARLFIEWFGANVATPLYKIAYEEHDENNKKEATLKVIANLDEKLSQLSSDGPFALGNEFTFADIATAPWAVQLEVGISDYNLSQDINKYKRYVAWKNAVLARPSVAQTAPTIEAIKERREKFREIIRQRNAAAAK